MFAKGEGKSRMPTMTVQIDQRHLLPHRTSGADCMRRLKSGLRLSSGFRAELSEIFVC